MISHPTSLESVMVMSNVRTLPEGPATVLFVPKSQDGHTAAPCVMVYVDLTVPEESFNVIVPVRDVFEKFLVTET